MHPTNPPFRRSTTMRFYRGKRALVLRRDGKLIAAVFLPSWTKRDKLVMRPAGRLRVMRPLIDEDTLCSQSGGMHTSANQPRRDVCVPRRRKKKDLSVHARRVGGKCAVLIPEGCCEDCLCPARRLFSPLSSSCLFVSLTPCLVSRPAARLHPHPPPPLSVCVAKRF